MSLSQRIKNHGQNIGLDEIKITTAENLKELRNFMEDRKRLGQLSKFVKDDLELITSPKKVLSGAKSIIVVAMSYHCNQDYDSRGLTGKLSKFVQGQDYHRVLGAKLKKLEKFLYKLKSDVNTYQFVDTGATVDRALAKKAGIGWQGKNCSIIHPENGSWIFIGGIITDLELKADQALEDKCGSCTKCLDACPTGALEEARVLNAEKCLGQVTLTKGYLSIKERKAIGTRVWGCDTCQEVCPYNQQAKAGNHPEFCSGGVDLYPNLISLLKLSNQEFKDRFGSTAMNWRGKRPIKRNAAIILGNWGEQRAVPDLMETLKNDPQAIVRGHAAWALGEIGTKEAKQGLKDVLESESDKKVKEEINFALRE